MAFDVSKRIDELTERHKELVLARHGLVENLERAKAIKDQLRQTDKEINWIIGALEALNVWNEELQPKAKAAGAETGGWGKGEPVV